jgi:cell division septation protein DedD
MAGQDFAQLKSPKKSKSDGKSGSPLAVFGIAFVAIACFAAGFWLGGNQGAQNDLAHPELDAAQVQLKLSDARVDLQQARIEVLEKLVEEWKKKSEEGATAKVGELKFYHDLPRQSVTPAPVSDLPASKSSMRPALPPHPAKPSLEKPKSVKTVEKRRADKSVKKASKNTAAVVYQVQMASFRAKAEASRFQKKLFNAGFSAFIHSVDLAGKGKWFRVYAGPYSSKEIAIKAQTDIQKQTKTRGLLVRGR